MSDDAIKSRTGCTWERWVHALDMNGAAAMSHPEIARMVRTKFKMGSWWAQSVTVGYERIKGIRARGQRRDGSYEVTKSRTYNVPVATLFEAWSDAAHRGQWLKEAGVKVRSATASKSMRLEWQSGGVVVIGFLPKGKSKSTVAVSHGRLPDRDTADRLKQEWSERLDALADFLNSRR